MIVSLERKFVFIHNPKTAGTSFRRAIEHYHDHHRKFWGIVADPFLQNQVDLAHLRSWELPIVVPSLFERLPELRSLVFVRHPGRRFISACFEYFHNFVPDAGFANLDIEAQRQMIAALVQNTLSHRLVMSDPRFVHFSPQKWYIFLGIKRIVSHVIPLMTGNENFFSAFDLLELPRVKVVAQNRSSTQNYSQLYTAEIQSFVENFYKIDLDYFAATDHLRAVAFDRVAPE